MGVALPLQRARPGSASAMAIPEDPGHAEPVHLRLHGHRRGVEVRAQLGIPALGADAAPGVRLRRRRRAGRSSRDASRSSPTTTPASSRRGPAYCQDGQSYTQERHAGRSVRHPPDHLAERDREPVQRVQPGFAVDDGAGVLHLRRSRARYPRRRSDSALQRTRYRELSPVGECGELRLRRSPRARPHRGRALGEPAHEHAAHPGVLADLLHARRVRRRRRAALGLQPVHDAGLQDDARVLRRRPDARAGRRACIAAGGDRLPDRRRAVAAGAGVAARSAGRRPAIRRSTCSGPAAPSLRVDGTSGPGTSATVSGWACDPEWPGGDGRASQSTAARRASSRAARCWARCAPTRRWRRRWRARSAPPATARAATTRATGSRSRCPPTSGQRVRLRDRRGDRRRAGRAADADPQRHRATFPAARTANTSPATR